MVIVFLFAFVLCFSLAGCTLQDRIEEYSSGKEQCYLNTENVTRFSYKGNDYTILADTVSNGGLGEWIGYIRQLAAINAFAAKMADYVAEVVYSIPVALKGEAPCV